MKLQGRRGTKKYEVDLSGDMPICQCQKPQFTGIPCNHVLAVCSRLKLDEKAFVSPFYSVQNYVNTWTGDWHSFGNENEWPLYHGPVLRPDPSTINRGRRKHKRIPMVMDIMEGRARSRQVRSASKKSRAARNARNAGATPPTRYFS